MSLSPQLKNAGAELVPKSNTLRNNNNNKLSNEGAQ